MVDDAQDREQDDAEGELEGQEAPSEDEDAEEEADEPGDEDEVGDEDLIAELEEEVESLRDRIGELERELAASRRSATTARWGSWGLGTFAVVVALVMVIIFLGRGFPAPGDQPAPEPEGAPTEGQEEALNALVMEHADELQSCLDALAGSSDLPDGTVLATSVDVEAGQGGAVAEVRVTGDGVPPVFAACIRSAVTAWTFPGQGNYLLQAPFEVRRRASGRGGDEQGGDGGSSVSPE